MEFKSKFVQRAQISEVNDTDYKGFAYDAAWLVALALNRTAQQLGPNANLDSEPFGSKNFSELFKGNLLATELLGVTVRDNEIRCRNLRITEISVLSRKIEWNLLFFDRGIVV